MIKSVTLSVYLDLCKTDMRIEKEFVFVFLLILQNCKMISTVCRLQTEFPCQKFVW